MLPLSNGAWGVDWMGVIEGLRAAGFQGAFTYEVHAAFNAFPEPLFELALHHSVAIARYLVAQFEGKMSECSHSQDRVVVATQHQML